MAGYAYSNNGLSSRAVEADWPLASGEVYFATLPAAAELQSAFPGYDAAVTAQTARAAAAALLAGGLTITSISTSALNGTYGTGMQDEININGLQAAVAANVFPGFYRDKALVRHTMTAAQFTAIATAILNFTVAVDEALATALGGGAWVAPSASATIA